MPNCVVKGCKKQSSKDKKQDGITFHTFPNRDQEMKQKWMEIIRKSRKELSWQPTSSSVVCSAHFKITDLYQTKKGLRRVVKNGYPKILPDITEGLDYVDLSQPPNVKEDPDALDLSIDLKLNQPSTSCAIKTAAAPNLSDLDLDQPSISCPVQTAAALDLSVPDLNQPSTLHAIKTAAAPDLSVPDLEKPSTSCDIKTAAAPDLSVPDLDQPSISCAVQPVQPDPSIFDTPKEYKLQKRVLLLETKLKKYKRKIKTLNQRVRRLHTGNKLLREMLNNLKKQNHIDTYLFKSLNVPTFNASSREKIKKNIKYTPAMKKFCLTLNDHSAKAYEYVRATLNTSLPHPKTLAKWYRRGRPLRGSGPQIDPCFSE